MKLFDSMEFEYMDLGIVAEKGAEKGCQISRIGAFGLIFDLYLAWRIQWNLYVLTSMQKNVVQIWSRRKAQSRKWKQRLREYFDGKRRRISEMIRVLTMDDGLGKVALGN